MTKKGKIFVEYWIQCGVCEYMEPLAATTSKAAQEERVKRGWERRYTAGYVCSDCIAKAYSDKEKVSAQ